MPIVRFNLTNKTDNSALIQAVFRYDNNKLVYSIRERINPAHWDKLKMRAKVTRATPQYESINANISKIETLILKIYNNYQLNNKELSIIDFKKELDIALGKQKRLDKITLIEFIDDFIQRREMAPNYSPKTLSKYRQLKTHFTNFCSDSKTIVDFNTVDLVFFDNFLQYLYNQNMLQNSAQKLIATLKTMLNDATERGLNSSIIFKSKKFNTPIEEVHSIYLDLNELKKLNQIDLSKKLKLDRVRDLFLIGAFTGLRFSDFTNIKSENIVTKDGNDLIIITPQKTGRVLKNVIVPIHPIVKSILQKYDGHTPKPLSNQKMNEYLKELGQIAEFTDEVVLTKTRAGQRIDEKYQKWELLTTHTARRSFATNAFKSGVPSISIMRITGHKTESSFMKYIKITNEENAILMSQHKFFTS